MTRRWARWLSGQLTAAAALWTLAACSPVEAPPGGAPVQQARASHLASLNANELAQHELGRKVWNFRCYFCHGYSGDARTLASTYLSPPPRDFTSIEPDALSAQAMASIITHGKAGTAMRGFEGILSPDEVEAVTVFVRREFIVARAANTHYHTLENGWPDHERYAQAFPFARGELALDTPWDQLDEAQQRGKRMFLAACVSCHDHARVESPGAVWETRALSYPRDAYCTSCHEQPDGSGPRPKSAPPAGHPPVRNAQAGGIDGDRSAPRERMALTYRLHDTPPALADATPRERLGEKLFQRDCAFCHAADGTAKSWIGRFLEPHPRDLTDPAQMAGMTRERLVAVIENGLEGTSMPAWKHVLDPAEIDALVAYIHRVFHPVKGL